jgi:acyl carrier protein
MNLNRFEALREAMAVTFGLEVDQINANSTQSQLAEWDSVAHLNLMLALEDAFNVRLTARDMQRLTSVPEILRHLDETCDSN